ncbi:hypothetical protein DIURU_003000 [Diutina rugosa]|uniref:Uncharacterized protein n=1 Tax=Diutina rugosa TaxID=5481 RepID=A0A642UNA5_DIURU|nr:uncharacterized protein DIURU_003000 [Diutina rugosa]KAA8902206.1 hypothetical protein DIURU_003000 [Diutina rugosa]
MSLASDLTTLAAETKRRHPEIRKLAESAVELLKSDPAKADVVEPLLQSCRADPKFGPIALSGLQKAISGSQLKDNQVAGVVEAFNAVAGNQECQLRVLQCIPPLVENYRDSVMQQNLLKPLSVVSSRLVASNDPIVQNTAFASLQQLFSSVFRGTDVSEELFVDLIALVEKRPLKYLPQSVAQCLTPVHSLEILESVMSNHPQFLSDHPESVQLVKVSLVPWLLGVLNGSQGKFALSVRSMRVLMVLVAVHSALFEIECELLVSTLNHILLAEESSLWLKILVLEVFKEIMGDFSVVERLFGAYDADAKKKNVVEEMMFVVANFVDNNNQLLTNSVQPFIPDPSSLDPIPYLASKHSAMRVSLLDHLDKTEPPTSIPSTYALLVALQTTLVFCDGVSSFVSHASSHPEEPELERRIEFANGVIAGTFTNVHMLLKDFLYTRMDQDLFHRYIKSFQRITHTSGLLGLDRARDQLLTTLKMAIITGDSSSRQSTEPTIRPTQKHQRSSSSMVNIVTDSLQTLTGTGATTSSPTIQPQQGFNSRQTVCLRAMANVVSHLGSTLGRSWIIVLTTLEACEQIVGSGPERSALDQVEARILDIDSYPAESIRGVFESLVALDGDGSKSYYTKRLVSTAILDPRKFLVDDELGWKIIRDHFESKLCQRSLAPGTRLRYADAYTEVLNAIAESGFQGNDTESTAELVMNALTHTVTALYALGMSSEKITTNCETEIVLKLLQFLHSVVDRYDGHLQRQWPAIFTMLNTPFERDQPELVPAAFDTLKLVVSDLVPELPHTELPGVIATLARFSNVGDINVSFSSVSYFWGIADKIRERAEGMRESAADFSKLESLEETPQFYVTLDLYLLQKLAEVTMDPRAQVRDGALQTVFQIIDAHPSAIDWNLVFKYCVDTIYQLRVEREKDWLESARLITSGLTSVYTKFLIEGDHQDKWQQLIDYFKKLVEVKWVELSIVVFTTFKDLLSYFKHLKSPLDKLFYDFWTSMEINWDFIDAQYQEMLATYLGCFPQLHAILPNGWDYRQVMAVLQKCAAYPVMPASIVNFDDAKRPSPLQQKVLDNAGILTKDMPEHTIQFLSSVVAYPVTVRPRIAAKVAQVDPSIKVPSFVAISRKALDLVRTQVASYTQFARLVDDLTVTKVLMPLVEVVRAEGRPEASELVYDVVEAMMKCVDEWKNPGAPEIWQCVLVVLLLNLEGSKDEESVQLAQYRKLCDKVVPLMLKHAPQQVVDEFVEQVYRHSFLYEDGTEEHDVSSLVDYDFDQSLGSTDPLEIFDRQQTRFGCMRQLISFLKLAELEEVATKWFMIRAARAMQRYISDARLLAKCPMPRIQIRELELVLEGLNSVAQPASLKQLYPLLVRVDAKSLLMKLASVQ